MPAEAETQQKQAATAFAGLIGDLSGPAEKPFVQTVWNDLPRRWKSPETPAAGTFETKNPAGGCLQAVGPANIEHDVADIRRYHSMVR